MATGIVVSPHPPPRTRSTMRCHKLPTPSKRACGTCGSVSVPINPRHPLLVASAAQTAQAAARGNFSLGIGLGGSELEQRAFGISAGKQVAHLREYLTVLRAVRDDGAVDFQGQELTARPPLSPVVAGGRPFPIYVAAMGPRALQVAGELADGTLPYLAGPRTIEEFIAPTIAQAAADAGRPPPRIIASVPVAVTKNPDEARAHAAKSLHFYNQFPSYQQIMAREGITDAADLAVRSRRCCSQRIVPSSHPSSCRRGADLCPRRARPHIDCI
jgi:F420-dependent oxidoreductase-like protein